MQWLNEDDVLARLLVAFVATLMSKRGAWLAITHIHPVALLLRPFSPGLSQAHAPQLQTRTGRKKNDAEMAAADEAYGGLAPMDFNAFIARMNSEGARDLVRSINT